MAMDEDQDGGLFNIQLSDEDDDSVDKRAHRTGQTEAHFQAVKQTYSAKTENGNISQTLNPSLGSNPNKLHVQQLLHAVEELYFFRRYRDAIDLVRSIFDANTDCAGLDAETRQLLSSYESRCKKRLESGPKQ